MQLQCVNLTDVLTAEELLRRWPGITEAQLAGLVDSRHLTAFQRVQQHKSPDGKLVSACLYLGWLGPEGRYDRNSTVFEADRIADFEKQRPQVMWTLVAPPTPPGMSAAPAPTVPPAPMAGRGQGTSPNETPEQFVLRRREEGVLDLKTLAAEVDQHFKNPDGAPLLSFAKIGALLPASADATVGYEAQKSQGQRLRGKK